jgi:hypothetical protein
MSLATIIHCYPGESQCGTSATHPSRTGALGATTTTTATATATTTASATTATTTATTATASATSKLFRTGTYFFNEQWPLELPHDADVHLETFRFFLDAAYTEDHAALMSLILECGRLQGDGGRYNNHATYMVSLAWVWEAHPKTFLSHLAPYVGTNSCMEDLLTLLSVITYNRFFPFEKLWDGKLSVDLMHAHRTSLRAKEDVIWKNMLLAFGVTSKDVVSMAASCKKSSASRVRRVRSTRSLYHPATLRRDETMTQSVSPYVSVPTSPCTPLVCAVVVHIPCNGSTTTAAAAAPGEHVKNTKNVWLNQAFKAQWQEARANLHHRNHGRVSGIAGTSEDYATLVALVVSSFAEGLLADDYTVTKHAPPVGGVYDNSTKGVLAFKGAGKGKIPASWGSSCGIAQAIAYQMYGDLVERQQSKAAGDDAVVSTDAQRSSVMAMYKKKLCGVGGQTPS